MHLEKKGLKAPPGSHKSVVPVSAPVLKRRLDGLAKIEKCLFQISDNLDRLQPLGVSAERKNEQASRPAVYPNFASKKARLQSFQLWPSYFKLRPEALSEAGLFYTGKGDETICFHCGGGLKNWEETDDAWTEHARHFGDCDYVLKRKGIEFVNQAKNLQLCQQAKEDVETLIESHKSSSPVPAYEDVDSFICGVLSKNNSFQEAAPERFVNEDDDKSSGASCTSDSLLCCVCFAEERNILFLPCRHLAVCSGCSLRLKMCVVCKTPCEDKVRAVIS